MSSILLTTFGGTWAILPELIGFVNYPSIKIFNRNKNITSFYHNLKGKGIYGIDKLWVICTNSNQTNRAIDIFNKWLDQYEKCYGKGGLPEIVYISIENLDDLTTVLECQQMADLIYRAVLKAKEEVQETNGKLLLSLAGGRKTMSSDMQRAADLWGCDLLFHIADRDPNIRFNQYDDLLCELPEERANAIFPLEINASFLPNPITEIPDRLTTSNFPVKLSRDNHATLQLFNQIKERLVNSESLHYNAYKQRRSNFSQTTFYALQQIHPSKFEKLSKEVPDCSWIKKLPKTDLHCHFGGFLNTQALIDVASVHNYEIRSICNQNEEFSRWNDEIRKAVVNNDTQKLKEYINNKNKLRSLLTLPKPVAVCAFINNFSDCPDYLDKVIFNDYLLNDNFKNIGIEQYEKLGDLQGSAILQSKETIERACDYVMDYCKEQNLRYLELRCSPCNYTQGNLTEEEVVKIMIGRFASQKYTDIRLIIIGSRHGDVKTFGRHVNLALNLINNTKYKKYIVGFDIAGNEAHKRPSDLRTMLLPLLKECVRFTIHAGENQPVDNIWEAVYELSADRIGHGLTLIQNRQLLQRFKDRNIFVELCPSSNFQIGDFSKYNYPLRQYFDIGLKVTINTDNPGISRTNITNEYLVSSEIANLSKLEVLQLLRNSFQAVFLPKDQKKQLLIRIEEELVDILKNE